MKKELPFGHDRFTLSIHIWTRGDDCISVGIPRYFVSAKQAETFAGETKIDLLREISTFDRISACVYDGFRNCVRTIAI